MKKILFYYHHFGGLGHGTRILSICREIKRLYKNAKIVVVNSGKSQPESGISKYAKVINLPEIEKRGEFNINKESNNFNEKMNKRQKILESIHLKFQPHVAVFEHFPFGRTDLHDEIDDFIDLLREKNVKIFSSVRDIIINEYDNRIEDFSEKINAILVHSDKELISTRFDLPEWIKDKQIITERVFYKSKEELIPKDKIINKLGLKESDKELIIVSVGGGIDGHDMIKRIIKIKKELDKHFKSTLLISTGTSVNKNTFREIKYLAKDNDDIKITKYNPNLLDYINASDLFISMAGYNSFNNSILTGVKTIFFPREKDEEQLKRIQTFEGGDYITNNMTDDDLKKKIIDVINEKNVNFEKFANEGATNTARFLLNSCEAESLKIRVTTECNLDCDMCSWKDKKERIPIKKIKDVIKDGYLLGVSTVNLTGGEPFLYPNIEKIVKYIKERQMRASISTNGSFNPENYNSIAESIDYVDISLDSFEKETHEKIRGRKDCFTKTLDSIKKFYEKDIKVHINVTVRTDNYRGIHKIINLIGEYARSISFTLVDTSMNSIEELIFSKEELETFYFDETPLILREAAKYSLKVEINPFFEEISSLVESEEMLRELLLNKDKYIHNLDNIFKFENNTCTLAGKSIRVNTDGKITPCCYLDDTQPNIGNIFKDSLIKMFMSKRYFEFINNAEPGKKECKYCKSGYVGYAKYFEE